MKCPVCDKGKLAREIRQVLYRYRGRTTTIRQRGRYCSACGEAILSATEAESYMRAIKIFRARIDAEPLTPAEVRRIRKRLGLTQRQADEIFDGGPYSFSQYERGTAQQSKLTDKLLRLLDKHPELIAELAADQAA